MRLAHLARGKRNGWLDDGSAIRYSSCVAHAIEYLFLLPGSDLQLRHRHIRERGAIIAFTVQLELLWRGTWRPIARYDTAHGFAHRDVIHPDGRVDKTPMGLADWNQALTSASDDLKTNWPWYRERFLQEASRHD